MPTDAPAPQLNDYAETPEGKERMAELKAWLSGPGRYAARDQIDAACRRIVRLERLLAEALGHV